MIVFEKLKLNKFRPVSVPRNKDLYARVGGRIPEIKSDGFTAEYGTDKLDTMAADTEYVEAQMLSDKQMPLDAKLD